MAAAVERRRSHEGAAASNRLGRSSRRRCRRRSRPSGGIGQSGGCRGACIPAEERREREREHVSRTHLLFLFVALASHAPALGRRSSPSPSSCRGPASCSPPTCRGTCTSSRTRSPIRALACTGHSSSLCVYSSRTPARRGSTWCRGRPHHICPGKLQRRPYPQEISGAEGASS